MNVKNKIFAIAMSFVICFCTVSTSFCNDKERIIEPLVVDGFVITAPMVATIGTLAVASGIVLSSDDDIYDIAYTFYLKHRDNWNYVQDTFNACVSVAKDGVVKVGADFLNLVKDCFDNLIDNFGNESSLTLNNGLWYLGKLKYNQDFYKRAYEMGYKKVIDNTDFSVGVFDFKFDKVQNGYSSYKVYVNGTYFYTFSFLVEGTLYSFATCQGNSSERLITYTTFNGSSYNTNTSSNYANVYSDAIDIPYVPGSYSPGGVLDKDDLGVYVPGNVSDLVGSLPSDVVLGGNPSYEYGGSVTLPGISNPSIDSTIDGTFNPSLDSDVPSDVPSEKPGDIVFPPMGGGLDFTPITQSSFTDKFPFSLAKDIKNIISVFDVEPKAPKFTVPIVSEELEIDLTQFNVWASIIRFFVLIGFIIALINITRKVIG